MKTYLFLSAVLLLLLANRPWGHFNQAVGIYSTVDSLRADTLSRAELDSLLPGPLAIGMPQAMNDSLTRVRQEQLCQLQQQADSLDQQIGTLDARVKKAKRTIQERQQSLLSMQQIEQLLVQQKQPGVATSAGATPGKAARELVVSDLETELNQRSYRP